MEDTSVYIAGELSTWPSKQWMATILRDAGLQVNVGRYSIRITDCADFVFQQYGGDLGDPVIDAGADSLEDMLHDGKLVSEVLASVGIRHRFEILDRRRDMVGYLHYDWPLEDDYAE